MKNKIYKIKNLQSSQHITFRNKNDINEWACLKNGCIFYVLDYKKEKDDLMTIYFNGKIYEDCKKMSILINFLEEV